VKTITKRPGSARTVLGRLLRRRRQGETVKVRAAGVEGGRHATARSDLERPPALERGVVAQGVIRREEVPLLTQYGTAYGLFDQWIADYDCVLTLGALPTGRTSSSPTMETRWS
jgi:hypothetical protein